MTTDQILEFINRIQFQVSVLRTVLRAIECAGVQLKSFTLYLNNIDAILNEFREQLFDSLGE